MPSREGGRRQSTDVAVRAETKLVWIMPSRERGRRQSTDGAVRAEAKLVWIMPKYRANESRVKLAWLCRVQLILNEVNRERGIRQSTDGVSYYGCHRWQYRILEWYADFASQDNA